MHRIKSLLQMLEDEPQDSFLLYALALEYKKTDLRKAIEILEELKNKGYMPSFYQLSELYLQAQESEKATQVANQGIELSQVLNDIHTLTELRKLLSIIELAS